MAPWPSVYNPWMGTVQLWSGQATLSLLVLRPATFPPRPSIAPAPLAYTTFPHGAPTAAPSWDPNQLAYTMNAMSLHQPSTSDWFMDSGVSSHLIADPGNLSSATPSSIFHPSHIVVGNGSLMPVTAIGSTSFPSPHRRLHLSNILISPHVVKNLVSFGNSPLTTNAHSNLTPLACL